VNLKDVGELNGRMGCTLNHWTWVFRL